MTRALFRTAALSLLAGVPGASLAEAPAPVAAAAIVERVTGDIGDLKRFDLLGPGDAVALEGGGAVLGYLGTCWQDSVSGGRLVVGPHFSRVESGSVTRRRVECDASALAQAGAGKRTARAGVALLPELPEPDITLYGRSPVFLLPGARSELTIERLDAKAEIIRAAAPGEAFDAVEQNIVLAAGGVYRAMVGDRAIVFRIDPLAEDGDAPVVGRMVILR